MPTAPSGRWEARIRRDGFSRIAGTDEAGRGCLAGPVVAAAVILRPGASIPGLRDSKLLSPLARRRLVPVIFRASIAWGLGAVSPRGIERHDIRRASFRAMRLAIGRLSPAPDWVIADGFRIPGLRIRQSALIGGDRRCRSIAAASVLAKVARDRRMDRYHEAYPAFGFDRHRGYPTQDHLNALARHGITEIHRRTFGPVRRLVESPSRLPL